MRSISGKQVRHFSSERFDELEGEGGSNKESYTWPVFPQSADQLVGCMSGEAN